MADRLMINQCFYHFKHLYKDVMKKKGSEPLAIQSNAIVSNGFDSAEAKNLKEQLKRMEILVSQRDGEIAILLSHLNKKQANGAVTSSAAFSTGMPV